MKLKILYYLIELVKLGVIVFASTMIVGLIIVYLNLDIDATYAGIGGIIAFGLYFKKLSSNWNKITKSKP